MLQRLLFVLLIALNIAVAAWLWLGEDGAHNPIASDRDVPRLQLLAEVPPAAHSVALPPPATQGLSSSGSAPVVAQTAPAPEVLATVAPVLPATPLAAASTKRSYRCLALGPFLTQADVRGARTALAPKVARLRTRQEQTALSHGWRVYLPALPTREQALALARKLDAKDVKDYFVVSSGDQPNTISLGLFHDPANARKRRDDVAALGFPARMSELTDSVPNYWLDLVVADDTRLDWHSLVRTAGVSAKATGCF
jgi:SPOR domain